VTAPASDPDCGAGPALADFLSGVLPFVPAPLIDAAWKERILATAGVLPSRFVDSLFGFECPLGTDEPAADFLVSAQTRMRGAELLGDTAAALESRHPDSSWSSIGALAERWQNDPRVDNFWLEFDLGGPAPRVPNLFFGPVRSGDSRRELLEVLRDYGPDLLGGAIDDELDASLRRSAEKLPERARVFQVGAMRARPYDGFRLCINEIYLDTILAFLEGIGYSGDLGAVRDLCVWVQPLVDAYALDVDLTPGVGPRVGFECYLDPRGDEASTRPRRDRFLAALVEAGACVVAKAESVARYPGRSDAVRHKELWAQPLKSMGGLLRRVSCFRRSLHHVKLSFAPGAPLQAKAYLAVHHEWLPAGEARVS
jgi:hypothetical protein